MWRNNENDYGIIAIALHWLVALSVFGLFALGLWMVELTYYDDWYRTAPNIHKGVGIINFVIVFLWLLWRLTNPHPRPEPNLSQFERSASSLVQWLLIFLLLLVATSGYLISTADGRPIDVFGLVQVPATITGLPNQADTAGAIHLALAITLISIACIHASAAIKHHFIDRDRTLSRMLGRRAN